MRVGLCMPQSNGSYSALSSVVYRDIALSINTHTYIHTLGSLTKFTGDTFGESLKHDYFLAS